MKIYFDSFFCSIEVFCLVCLIFLIVFFEYAYAGTGTYTLGIDPRVVGRGGADIAVANDTFSIALNPAGMAQINGKRFDTSLALGVAFTHFENDYNDKDGDPFYFAVPSMGYVHNPAASRWSYGIALYSPGGLGTSYKLYQPLYEKKLDYEDALMPLRISPAVAYKITSNLTIGFAPCLSYTTLDLKMPFTVSKDKVRETCQGEPFSGITYGEVLYQVADKNLIGADEYVVKADITDLDDFTFGFVLGLLYNVNSRLSIGFSYVSRQEFDLEGKFELDANRQLDALKKLALVEILERRLPNQGTKGYFGTWDSTARYIYPQKIGVGISYKPVSYWHFVFDAVWIEWSDFLGYWTMEQTNGDNEDLNAIIGDISFTGDILQGWRDSYTLSFGLEYEYSKHGILRGGFAHCTNVIPSHNITPTGPALSKDHLTLGWGYFWESHEFNISYEHIFRNSSRAVSSHTVGRDYDNSKVSIGVNIVHMMYSFHF